MKLLIITQKVNKDDSILGFFHRWIEEFSKNVESVVVICLEKGEFNLPQNVKVVSLGKELGAGRIKRVINFYKYIWQFRKEYDSVFVHMNQIYIILGGLFWRIFRKKISLWYAHGKVSLSLKISEKITNLVFTSTYTGFNLRSKKRNILGQGIDVNHFKPAEIKKNKNQKSIITVGRISNVKNISNIVDIVSKLEEFSLDIVGSPIHNNDFDYAQDIYLSVQKNNLSNRIIFSGPIKQEYLPEKLNNAHIFINLSKTNSLDKVILEALACGLQVITTNVAAKDLIGVSFVPRSSVEEDDLIITEKIKELSKRGINMEGRNFVVEKHSINNLIKNIVSLLNK